MWHLFSYEFMQRAFVAGLIIAVVSPIIGSFLVTRKLSLVADTLSHVSLVGVAIGLLMGAEPLVVTLVVTILVAITIEIIRYKGRLPGETVLAMLLPGGLAVSLVLLGIGSGLNANILSYLFGSITTVTQADLVLSVILAVLVVATVVGYYRQLLFAAFDEDAAKLNGIPVFQVNILLMVLTAIVVTIAMRIVGALLVGALMVIPVVTASRLAKSFYQSMILAIIISILAVCVGLVAAYFFNLPAGGAIVLAALLMFGLSGFSKV